MAGLFLSTPILLLLAAFTPRASSNQASAQVAAASDAPVRAGQIFQGVVLVPAPAVRRETAEPVPVWVEFPTGQTSAGADARPARWMSIRERSGADGESQGAGPGSGRAAVTSAG
jgi:hypothetical protein